MNVSVKQAELVSVSGSNADLLQVLALKLEKRFYAFVLFLIPNAFR